MKRWRSGSWAALAAAAIGAAQAQPPVPEPAPVSAPVVIGAPYYGDVLFRFYQNQYFAAITGLMVSQHFGRIAPHDEEAEVLRGGMLLSYGLHDEAAGVFARLIEHHAPPAVRDRAWVLLAQARWQRGLLDGAEEALARVAGPLAQPLEDQRQLLRAQLLMARQDDVGAIAVLKTLQASPAVGLYAHYNLGVALVRSGDSASGRESLEAVGLAGAADEEQRSLRDRANVALGYAALQAGQPLQARAALQRVRLNALQSNKALLAFGWAAAELNDPALALVPWAELAARPDNDAAVLEARIAVPYAMAEMGAYGQALQGYQRAAEGYERERHALDESIAAIGQGRLVQALLDANPEGGAELGAAAGLRALPAMPHAAHLVPLLASDEFQQALRNLRDLQFLDANLQQWQDSLGSYTDMLDNRRRAFAARLPAVREQAARADLEAQQRRRDGLAAELAAAEQDGDAFAFADARESDLLLRMGRALGELARMDDSPEQAAAGERLRRVAGALTWQRMQAFPERLWETKKNLRAADAALAEARRRHAELARAQRDEPARQQAFAQRIAELTQRVAALRPIIATVAQAQRQQVQELASAELRRKQERLKVYEGQARLAVAQILDRAQLARREEATPAPTGARGEGAR